MSTNKHFPGVPQRRRAQRLAEAPQPRRGAAAGPLPAAVAGVLRHGARRRRRAQGPAEPVPEPRPAAVPVADTQRHGQSVCARLLQLQVSATSLCCCWEKFSI